jgi:ribosome-dependent ATPase
MIDPVASLQGAGRFIGSIYPTAYFMTISRGVFSKGLGFSDLSGQILPILIAIPVLFALAVILLKKQPG